MPKTVNSPRYHNYCVQSKHMILLKDTTVQEIIRFLEQCEGMYVHHKPHTSNRFNVYQATMMSVLYFVRAAYGRSVPCRVEQPLGEHTLDAGKNTVTFEARLLKP